MKTKLITLLIAITTIIGSAYAQKKIEVYKNGEIVYSEYITDIDSIKFKEHTAPLPGTENGHEYVDLGLPSGIKWATCNVGANSPEEYGDYFAWGETEPKDYYGWITYKYCNGSSTTLTKYCVDSSYGTVDNKTVLDLADDAANANWGGNWRMPTKAERDELRDTNNCTWEWTTQNGVNGYKVTSKANGNSIFLPAAGYRNNDNLNFAGSNGHYWSSSLSTSGSLSAYYLYFNSSYVYWYYYSRCFGLSVRAVYSESTPTPSPIVCTVSVSATEGGTAVASATEVKDGETVTLTATPNEGYRFVNWTVNGEVVSTDNPYTAMVTENSEFVANFVEAYHNGHEYVDLGLPSGIKWATCNVGATAPEEYGDYFAWGETESKEIYDWSTYKYCNGTETSLTKYCTNSDNGTVDNKTELESEDDAARINWGGNWRIPTNEEIDELRDTNNCTWSWTTQNGVDGYKVTSKVNGNSIFLPAAGLRHNGYSSAEGGNGYYCSSSLGTGYSSDLAYFLFFRSGSVDWSSLYRYCGLSVRAVCDLSTPTPSPIVCTVSVSATEGGTAVASATEVKDGETVTLTATPNEGYRFVNWTVNGEVVSIENPFTATITADTEFVANFEIALSESAGTENGYEYVDLGLPSGVKWATCNVGATAPEEYGDYFAWGETAPKTTYNWSSYKYCNGTETSLTKYCVSSSYGIVDNRTILGLEDDAANANWGGNWRMPTEAEQDELRNTDNCTWEWTTQNGVNGYKVISKINGNSIFLPAAGYYNGNKLYSAGDQGDYKSSLLYTSNSNYACGLDFYSSSVRWSGNYRCYGGPVRAVYAPLQTYTISVLTADATMGSVTTSATELEYAETVILTATSNEGYKFGYWTVNGEIVSTENPYTATITANKEFVANFVTSLSDSNGTENGYEYVDLGLPSGIKWATCNVGATAPEEYGGYYAWGETNRKTVYDWSTYKYCNDSYVTLTKYCTDSSYGTVDNKTVLELEDDAARINWGGNWRMPTKEELDELKNTSNCIWEWTTKNGVNGYKVTSKVNANSIFLPAAGYCGNGYISGAGSNSYYWSSSLCTSDSRGAYNLAIYSSSVGLVYSYRCDGKSVRAVCP